MQQENNTLTPEPSGTTPDKTRVNKFLYALLGSHDLVELWWNGANKAFGGLSPNQVWVDDYRQVVNYVLRECSW